MGKVSVIQTGIVSCLVALASGASCARKADKGSEQPRARPSLQRAASSGRPDIPPARPKPLRRGEGPTDRAASGLSGRHGEASPKGITITVLYNNVPRDRRLQTAWGMSCLIEGMGTTVLFDTGGDGRILLSNMKKLGKSPQDVHVVALSHIHADHVGGLWEFLRVKSDVELYLPESFPRRFKTRAERAGAKVIPVGGPVKIAEGVHSTGCRYGEKGTSMKEQSLVLETGDGLVVVTGCAHPGVVNVVRKAKEICKGEVRLVTGGFHLMAYSEREVARIIRDLKRLGVKRVGPSHCTGGRPIEMFKEAWGKEFIDLGCGAKITIPAGARPRHLPAGKP